VDITHGAVWQHRALTPQEQALAFGPTFGISYDRCQIGRNVFRVRSSDEKFACHHRFIKQGDVVVQDHPRLTTDYYGELVGIFQITLPTYGTFLLLRGDWFRTVTPHSLSKTFLVDPRLRNNDNPFATATTISGQFATCPHPQKLGKMVIFDRTADYLECEELTTPIEVVTQLHLDREPLPAPEPLPQHLGLVITDDVDDMDAIDGDDIMDAQDRLDSENRYDTATHGEDDPIFTNAPTM
jgi:hypothetical protein